MFDTISRKWDQGRAFLGDSEPATRESQESLCARLFNTRIRRFKKVWLRQIYRELLNINAFYDKGANLKAKVFLTTRLG